MLFRLLDILVPVPRPIKCTKSCDTQIWLVNSLGCNCISTFQATWKVQYITSYYYYGFLISFILARNGACLASLTCFLSKYWLVYSFRFKSVRWHNLNNFSTSTSFYTIYLSIYICINSYICIYLYLTAYLYTCNSSISKILHNYLSIYLKTYLFINVSIHGSHINSFNTFECF